MAQGAGRSAASRSMVPVVPRLVRAGCVLRGRFAAPQDEGVGSYARKENPRQGFDIAHFAEEKDAKPPSFLGIPLAIFSKEERILPARSAFFARKRAFPRGAISFCAGSITRAAREEIDLTWLGFDRS